MSSRFISRKRVRHDFEHELLKGMIYNIRGVNRFDNVLNLLKDYPGHHSDLRERRINTQWRGKTLIALLKPVLQGINKKSWAYFLVETHDL
jgi:hypothetical protein